MPSLLCDMLNPQLERALEERRAQSSISEQVKWILWRLLAGSLPEISAVAHRRTPGDWRAIGLGCSGE